MQTLEYAKKNYAIWRSKIGRAFKDGLKGEDIDRDDVELAVDMFVEIVSTSSSDWNQDTIVEALECVSSNDDDDFDTESISKDIFERIELLDVHALPVRTIYFSIFGINFISRTTQPQTKLPTGTTCRARLKEDKGNNWHNCVVVKTLSKDEDNDEKIVVKFLDFGNMTREVDPKDLIYEVEVNDYSYLGDGRCVMCERVTMLTFHHLIPKTTHRKLKKLDPKRYTRKSMSEGIMICRPCHSTVHQTETELSLALNYFTLKLIREHPKIKKWIQYARKQRDGKTRL